jgi:hypothetical protein
MNKTLFKQCEFRNGIDLSKSFKLFFVNYCGEVYDSAKKGKIENEVYECYKNMEVLLTEELMDINYDDNILKKPFDLTKIDKSHYETCKDFREIMIFEQVFYPTFSEICFDLLDVYLNHRNKENFIYDKLYINYV